MRSELVSQLQELAKRGLIFPAHLPKSGKEITTCDNAIPFLAAQGVAADRDRDPVKLGIVPDLARLTP
jgi:hypothetical protein